MFLKGEEMKQKLSLEDKQLVLEWLGKEIGLAIASGQSDSIMDLRRFFVKVKEKDLISCDLLELMLKSADTILDRSEKSLFYELVARLLVLTQSAHGAGC
jgi:hypothetical protein